MLGCENAGESYCTSAVEYLFASMNFTDPDLSTRWTALRDYFEVQR